MFGISENAIFEKAYVSCLQWYTNTRILYCRSVPCSFVISEVNNAPDFDGAEARYSYELQLAALLRRHARLYENTQLQYLKL